MCSQNQVIRVCAHRPLKVPYSMNYSTSALVKWHYIEVMMYIEDFLKIYEKNSLSIFIREEK